MSMMNDYEEALDEFPAENKEKPAESMVGAYPRRVDRSTAGSGITTKIPPLDGSLGWSKHWGVDRRLCATQKNEVQH